MRKVFIVGMMLCLPLSAMAAPCDGVPEAITSQIKESVAKRHPGNYSIQRSLLGRQCEDYLELQNLQSDIPLGVFDEIKSSVASRHPGNYSIQLSLIKKQCEDYTALYH